jgi:chromosomal replication initiation ATPase DnaA
MNTITVAQIIEAVAAETGISAHELMSDRRAKPVCRARFLVIGLAFGLTRHSSVQIGRALGNRDHTTIIHARARCADYYRDDPDFHLLMGRAERRLDEAGAAS